jgi:hypothetical protein
LWRGVPETTKKSGGGRRGNLQNGFSHRGNEGNEANEDKEDLTTESTGITKKRGNYESHGSREGGQNEEISLTPARRQASPQADRYRRRPNFDLVFPPSAGRKTHHGGTESRPPLAGAFIPHPVHPVKIRGDFVSTVADREIAITIRIAIKIS